MVTIRRWYIFLVCAVSLQLVTWASIALLRNLIAPLGQPPTTAIAFQIAIILIGLPFFLVHWLWAQRLAARHPDERRSTLRRLYLYAMQAAFLAPFVANTYALVVRFLSIVFGQPLDATPTLDLTGSPFRNLIAMGILALLWFYQYRLLSAEGNVEPDTGEVATLHRLYVYGFTAVGLVMTGQAMIAILRWALFQLGRGSLVEGPDTEILIAEVARLLVGLPLWLIFWSRAQSLFASSSDEERESALRKFYLYVIVFVAALSVVTSITMLLAGVFRRLLALPSQGDFRTPLSVIIAMAGLWAYQAYVLRSDVSQTVEAPRQAGVRRLYLYLVASIGLAAFLVGLSGDISVLIRSLSGVTIGEALKDQLAWFTAALLAGLPVWLLPWRQAQAAALDPTSNGTEERRSIVRKIYLYFYLFVATMTVLSSAVYIVSRFLSILLGSPAQGNLVADLGQAIAFTFIGMVVWLYHGFALRQDGQLNRQEQAGRAAEFRLALLNLPGGLFCPALLQSLQRELPELILDPISLAEPDSAPGEAATKGFADRLAQADLIVAPWNIALAGSAVGAVTPEIADAISLSRAPKLLAPLWIEGWKWAGVDQWTGDALVNQTVHAVKSLVQGEEIKVVRPLGFGAIVGIVLGVLLLLIVLITPLLMFFGDQLF